jgi:ABC-type transport system involved in multi-copper enzyme maturation permease subunit
MTWLIWQQHKRQAALIGIVLTLFAVAVVVTGIHMTTMYRDAVRACGQNATCTSLDNIFHGYGAIVDTVHMTIALPVLLGALAATFVAGEVERGTHMLAWTQAITRTRWSTAKIATAAAGAVAIGAAVSALVTWWSNSPNALYGNRFEGAQFDTQNLVPIAFCLFAVALGLALSSLIRRTLPAIAATVGIFAAVRILVSVYLRPHYMGTVAVTGPIAGDTHVPSGSWTVSQHFSDAAGHATFLKGPNSCTALSTKEAAFQCLTRSGYRSVTVIHPASQYWHYQIVESILYTVPAALLFVIAYFAITRHDA